MTGAARIVVVDDEPDLRAAARGLSGQRTGLAVRCAAVGRRARPRCCASEPADVLMLDVNMPGEDGFAIVARLRRAGSTVGIVMLTAAGTVEQPAGGPRRRRRRLSGQAVRAARAAGPRPQRPAPGGAAEPATPAAGAARGRRRLGRCRLDLDAHRLLDAQGGEIALTAMEFDLLGHLRPPPQPGAVARAAERARPQPAARARATAASTSASPGCAPRSARTRARRGRSGRCTARAMCSTRTRDFELNSTHLASLPQLHRDCPTSLLPRRRTSVTGCKDRRRHWQSTAPTETTASMGRPPTTRSTSIPATTGNGHGGQPGRPAALAGLPGLR